MKQLEPERYFLVQITKSFVDRALAEAALWELTALLQTHAGRREFAASCYDSSDTSVPVVASVPGKFTGGVVRVFCRLSDRHHPNERSGRIHCVYGGGRVRVWGSVLGDYRETASHATERSDLQQFNDKKLCVKLKAQNAIHTLTYLHLVTHANFTALMWYRSRFFVNKLNSGGRGYVLQRRFTEFGEIT